MPSRRQVLVSGAAAAAVPALSACRNPPKFGAAHDLDRMLGGFTNELLSEYPENATFLGMDSGARATLKTKLTDRSAAADTARAASCADRLTRLRTIDRKALTGMDAVNYDVVLEAHEEASEGYRNFRYGDNCVLNALWAESNTPYVVSQGSGDFATIPDFLDSQHKISTRADADAYLDRLNALGGAIDAETERVRKDAALGVAPPDFLLDLTLGQMTKSRARPIPEWGMIASVTRRAREKKLNGAYETTAGRIVEQQVAPAIDRQIAELTALRAKAVHDAGVWRLPDGEAYYAWLLKIGTTTAMTADDIHKLGQQQVREIGDQMDQILKAQGLTQGTVGQRMDALAKDPKFLFAGTDEGRAQLIAYLNGQVKGMREKLPEAFHTLPKADLVIKRVPPDIEAGAPDGYEQDGSIDGSRPASYYINLRDMDNWPRFSLPTLTFHEGLPGHVWQGVFSHRLPPIRSLLVFNAYVEGWALYAEQLADELGMYANDPFGKLGYLQSIQFRACRLVVDTGMHSKRWSREQAIKWLMDNNGSPADQARAEIDRYCAWPGQATGYKVGHNKMNQLRDKARARLGGKFDLKSFDDALVLSGAMPLTVLDRVIDDWIAAKA